MRINWISNAAKEVWGKVRGFLAVKKAGGGAAAGGEWRRVEGKSEEAEDELREGRRR
jgi:hypothetical protein